MNLSSPMSLIVGVIRPEQPELFALELESSFRFFFFMVRGRDPGLPSWGKMHQYSGKFIVGYLACLLLIFKQNVSINN